VIRARMRSRRHGASCSLAGKEGQTEASSRRRRNSSGTSGSSRSRVRRVPEGRRENPKRTILFMGLSGEEKGARFPCYYTETPHDYLGKGVFVFFFFFSFLSFLVDDQSRHDWAVPGTGPSTGSGMAAAKMFQALVQADSTDSKPQSSPRARGDGPSVRRFFRKTHPVSFFTRSPTRVHRPTITWEKINAPVAVANRGT